MGDVGGRCALQPKTVAEFAFDEFLCADVEANPAGDFRFVGQYGIAFLRRKNEVPAIAWLVAEVHLRKTFGGFLRGCDEYAWAWREIGGYVGNDGWCWREERFATRRWSRALCMESHDDTMDGGFFRRFVVPSESLVCKVDCRAVLADEVAPQDRHLRTLAD